MPVTKEDTLRNYFQLSLNVLKIYQWLLDLYVLDFFVDDHWNKLPLPWRESLTKVDPQTLGNILSGNPSNTLMPLSFLSLLCCVKHLSISRNNAWAKNNNKAHTECLHASHPKLENLFLKHVKLKKRHEISLMSEVVSMVAMQTNCNSVLDFGSGLGHLVRVLSYKYNLYAAGIECQLQLTNEARKLDLEFEYTASKHLSKEQMQSLKRPTHINMTLTNHEQLLEINLPQAFDTYGLVGLHPCGDLGPLLLKHFVSSDQLKFICLVGCCYMKLTEYGYPLSKCAKSLDSKLSYPSREIACHAVEVYCEKLTKGDYQDLKIHAYRAALETILVNINSTLKHTPVRSIKHTDTMTFERYCSLAFEKLSVPMPIQPELWIKAQKSIEQWRRVVIVYSLRLMLAPLVETVVLLDRMLYVLENDLECDVQPVFDCKISPRNHIMIARRK